MVYMLLADGFEEIEAVYPLDVLRRCGVNIQTAGVPNQYITGANKITIQADVLAEEVCCEDIEMLILPGGPGRDRLKADPHALKLIKHCCETGIPVAAICGAPEILGELGYLCGKKATCYPGLECKLTGAEVVMNEAVVVDGNMITAQGAGTSEAFAYIIAEQLCGTEKAQEVFGKMVCGKLKYF
jgi:4-methyl-5(b-hydroxyethyl)-thiazole monophosphate biosynthesis